MAVTDQLLETAGNMDCPLRLDDVQVYLKGRVETTGFDIADAAVVGDVSGALAKLRHALGIGVAPVVIVAAMAMKFGSCCSWRRRPRDWCKRLVCWPT
ncbi:hypothetical protein [Mobiluncus mulieris]|uniref:hypothetical protein n=1 Tax=Mobiluncus mulieris TaxID=2052 RepID=UPI0020938DEA|nr:hypothetical protein [Mobiluncus mulieris]